MGKISINSDRQQSVDNNEIRQYNIDMSTNCCIKEGYINEP